MANFKTIKSINDLKRGDIVRQATDGALSYVVESIGNNEAIAVRTIGLTNPSEWVVFVPYDPIEPTEEEIDEAAWLKISDDYSGHGGFSPRETWKEAISWYKQQIAR